MTEAALAGLFLGASLIIAIGAQNAFVLRLGLLRRHVLPVVLICAFSDALLITAGAAGMGAVIAASPHFITAISLAGGLFLFVYGLGAFKRSMAAHKLDSTKVTAGSLNNAILTALALTFLNPHVYLDTVVLLGGLSAVYEGPARFSYAAGAILASFIWFFMLGFGARYLAPVLAKPAAWRTLEIAIGLVMWLIAAQLVWPLIAP